jgi:hypothetical protein
MRSSGHAIFGLAADAYLAFCGPFALTGEGAAR